MPTVAALADGQLGTLLAAFPALYHSHACYAALLAQLQEEEGDAPMGQVRLFCWAPAGGAGHLLVTCTPACVCFAAFANRTALQLFGVGLPALHIANKMLPEHVLGVLSAGAAGTGGRWLGPHQSLG